MKNLLLFSLLCSVYSLDIIAQDGNLDITFNNKGFDYQVIDNEVFQSLCSEIQNDGKIIIGGYSTFGNYEFPAIVRIKIDGKIDSSFNIVGANHIGADPSINTMRFTKLAIQEDGKIIALGKLFKDNQCDYTIVENLYSFNTDGSIDSTFGNNGKYEIIKSSASIISSSFCLQKNGGILISFSISPTETKVLSLRKSGQIDSLFANNGLLTIKNTYHTGDPRLLQMHGEQHFVIANYEEISRIQTLNIQRYNINGQLDQRFGNNGNAVVNLHRNSTCTDLKVLLDDNLLISGIDYQTNDINYFICKLTSNGVLHAEFNGTGFIIDSFSNDKDKIFKITESNDESILCLGYAHSNNYSQSALAKYNKDGSVDSIFGNNGKKIFTKNDGIINSVLLNQNNKYSLIGNTAPQYQRVTLQELSHNGIINYYKEIKTNYGALNITDCVIAITENNSIVSCGNDAIGSFVINYNEDGHKLIQFKNKELLDLFENFKLSLNNIASQEGGKILLLARNHEKSLIFLIRINSDGSLDHDFGNSGYIKETIDNPTNIILKRLKDNNILIGCELHYNPGAIDSYHSIVILKYNDLGDKLLKNSRIEYSFDIEKVTDIDVQVDGKILVTCLGTSNNFNNYLQNIFLIRFNEDGSLDFSFNENGIVKTDIKPSINISKSTINRSGNIITITNGIYFSNSSKENLCYHYNNGHRNWNFGFGKYEDYFLSYKINNVNIIHDKYDRVIVSFDASTGNRSKLIVGRLLENGNLDKTFGNDGFAQIDLGHSAGQINSLEIDYKNRIVISGTATIADVKNYFIARINNSSPSLVYENNLENSDFDIFPNPNSGRFNVQYNKQTLIPNSILQISDLTGKIHINYKQTHNMNEINSNLEPGTYVVLIKLLNEMVIHNSLLLIR